MKKLIALFLCINILFGCSGMQQLRTSENYKKGHNEQVKYAVIDKNKTAEITIPVSYDVKYKGSLPEELPEKLKHTLEDIPLTNTARCKGYCNIDNDKLTVYLTYNRKSCGGNYLLIFLSPLLLPLIMGVNMFECGGLGSGLEMVSKPDITIVNPFEELNQQNLGVNVRFNIMPNGMTLSCSRKSCAVVDKQNIPVNKIKIEKTISIDNKRIKELFAEEEKIKREEAKRKAKEERIKKEIQKKQGFICPSLLDTMTESGYKYKYSSYVRLELAKEFQKYECGEWLSHQPMEYKMLISIPH